MKRVSCRPEPTAAAGQGRRRVFRGLTKASLCIRAPPPHALCWVMELNVSLVITLVIAPRKLFWSTAWPSPGWGRGGPNALLGPRPGGRSRLRERLSCSLCVLSFCQGQVRSLPLPHHREDWGPLDPWISQLCRDFGTDPHKGTKGPERQRVSPAQLRFAGTPGPWGCWQATEDGGPSPPGGRHLTHTLIIMGVMWLLGKDTHVSGAEQRVQTWGHVIGPVYCLTNVLQRSNRRTQIKEP